MPSLNTQIQGLVNFFKNMPELDLDDSKKKILLIYGASALVVLIGYISLFLKPSIAKITGLNPSIRERKQAIKSIEDELLRGTRLDKRFEALQVKLGGYGKKLSREKEVPTLLKNLSAMAEASEVKIVSITPQDAGRKTRKGTSKKESVYQEIPIAITAESGYHELGSFINELEKDERYMQVSNIRIDPKADDETKHKVEFIVYAYIFRQ
jgi:type IV pilus assembly protein PilO